MAISMQGSHFNQIRYLSYSIILNKIFNEIHFNKNDDLII